MKRYHAKSINMLNDVWKEMTISADDAVETKIPGTEESVFLRKFEDIGLSYIESLSDITPEVVDFIIDRCWVPGGFIAWRIIDNMQQMIYFKGKVAIITVFRSQGKHFVKDYLREATSCNNLDRKIVIHTTDIVRNIDMCVA